MVAFLLLLLCASYGVLCVVRAVRHSWQAIRLARSTEPGYVLHCECGGTVEIRVVTALKGMPGGWHWRSVLARHAENPNVANVRRIIEEAVAAQGIDLDVLTLRTPPHAPLN